MTQQQPKPTPPGSDPAAAIARLRGRLDAIARRLRMVLVLRAVLVCLGALVLGALAIGGLDLLLRLPASVRIVLLAGLLALVIRLVLRRVLPAISTRLRPTDVALLIERRHPSARGLLASAVDLEHGDVQDADDVDDEPDVDAIDRDALRLAALRSASRRFESFDTSSLLRLGVLARPAGAVAVLAAIVTLIGVLNPTTLRVGAHRVLTPWDATRWPVRYAIDDITPSDARAVDAPVPIRALIGNPQTQLDDTTRTLVTWRLLDENGNELGDWSRTLLMPQRKRDTIKGVPVYEQLIDVRDRAARVPEQQRLTLEYRITTRDDATRTNRLVLARPPQLQETIVDLSPPQYASALAQRGSIRAGQIESDKSDLLVRPVLAGTRVALVWKFSKPVAWDEQQPQWVQRVASSAGLVAFDQPDERSIRLELIANESIVIEPAVRDRAGIPVRTPIIASLEVLEDLSPSARIIEPTRDEQVTAQARVEIGAELSDDFGLTRATIRARRASPPEGSSGAPPEPIGEPIEIAETTIDIEPSATLTHTLDLSTLVLEPGDELRVWATAWDLRANESDPAMGSGESSVRVLRIVEQRELIEQVRRALDPMRGNLRQLDERQAELQRMLRDRSPRTADEQRSLSERLRANQRAIEQLSQTVRRNNLDDEALRATLNDASGVLEQATQQSERAQEQISRGSNEPASQSQRRVRDQIGELLAMLDQGQDAWLALRNVQQLRSDLETLREDTQELSQRTAGQTLDELSADDRSALQQILDRQLQNAEDARQAINTLDQRAQELQENDPTQAQALRRAAQQARAAQLEQKLREAGAQIQQNQTGNATQSQDEVLEELEELLEELENTIQNRDNALRRELASIIDSIKGLIDAQERELIRLDRAKLSNDFTDLDARIIALVGNTLSVRDEALGAFPETRIIADHIGRAGAAQNTAISALRANPPEADRSEQAQRGALQHLFNALEEAQRLDEQAAQRQAQRAREELKAKYEQALDTQSRIHDETLALGQDPLARRERSQARAIGQQQIELTDELTQMPQETEGLSEAPVFTLAHAQLDRLMAQSSQGLGERQITTRTTQSQRQSMMILSSLIEVLGEQQQDQAEDFDDGGSQGGGQGGGQGSGDEPLIPPVAELRLLRSMQQLVADQTRSMSEMGSAPDQAEVRAVGELQKQLFEQGADLIERINPTRQPSPQPQPQPSESEDDAQQPNPDPREPVENDGGDDQ